MRLLLNGTLEHKKKSKLFSNYVNLSASPFALGEGKSHIDFLFFFFPLAHTELRNSQTFNSTAKFTLWLIEFHFCPICIPANNC